MNDNHKASPIGTALGLAIAAAIGAAVGIMFAPKSGEKTRKEIKNKAEDLNQKAQDLAQKFGNNLEKMRDQVMESFGEINEHLQKSYLEMKGDIIAEIDDIKDKNGLTEDKYKKIVRDIVEKYAREKKWPTDKVERLKKNFQKDWSHIKEKLSEE